jgi:hypothetical protein
MHAEQEQAGGGDAEEGGERLDQAGEHVAEGVAFLPECFELGKVLWGFVDLQGGCFGHQVEGAQPDQVLGSVLQRGLDPGSRVRQCGGAGDRCGQAGGAEGEVRGVGLA